MPPSFNLGVVASEMQAAQEGARQLEPFTSRFSDFDLPSAYAAADLIHQDRLRQGALPVGRKIGFTNPDMWAIYGVKEPVWGYVYDRTVVHLDSGHGSCTLGGFAEAKIEPEIIFHFHAAPAPGSKPEAILACVDWVALGFEVVQSHFPGWRFQATDTVVDGGLHARLLVGEHMPVDQLGLDAIVDLERFYLELFCGNQLRERGSGTNVLGHPLLAVAHLMSVLGRQPQYPAIGPGELISTGTITSAHAVAAGQTWRASVQGIALPEISVDFQD